MERHNQHHHQYHQHQISVNVDAIGVSSSDNRFPQWSIQETKEFLMIRSELDRTFMETKRNKLLWEIISNKMKEKGYNRSPDQCKCKWKNLVTRYKGCETAEPESSRQQFPFYNELQAIFAARMQRILWAEAEGSAGGGGAGASKKKMMQLSSDEGEEIEESHEELVGEKRKKKKSKLGQSGGASSSSSNSNVNNLRETLKEFMKQQMQMEMQWREAYQARENERRLKEMEWRQTMESLENERILMERRWREREEQRMIREEARAEKRDALVTALLNKLRRDDNL